MATIRDIKRERGCPITFTATQFAARLVHHATGVHPFPHDFGNMLTWKTERGSHLDSQHRYSWFAVSCVTFLLSVLFVTPTHAQLKPALQSIDATQIRRQTDRRDANNFPYYISYADCKADDVLTFKLQITNPSVNFLEVWAGGTDCSQLSERQGSLAQCWRVFRQQVTKSPASIPIRAQDIVAQNGPSSGTNDRPGVERDCEKRASLDIKLHFMYINDASAVSSNVVTFADADIDLAGPIPPSLEKLLPSDDSLIAEWENTDTTMFAGYRLYCSDAVEIEETTDASSSGTETQSSTTETASANAGGDAAVGLDAALDASVSDLSSADTTSSTGSTSSTSGTDTDTAQSTTTDETSTTPQVAGCGGDDLKQGKYPTDDLRVCGTVDSYSARSGTAKGLRNGRSYAVGVTAIDRLGNESTLSNIECNVPREVYTFYEDYRSSGGDGGGGFCAISGVGQQRFNFQSLLFASLAFVLAYYRRNSQS